MIGKFSDRVSLIMIMSGQWVKLQTLFYVFTIAQQCSDGHNNKPYLLLDKTQARHLMLNHRKKIHIHLGWNYLNSECYMLDINILNIFYSRLMVTVLFSDRYTINFSCIS